MLKIMLIDSQRIVRCSVKKVLESSTEFSVIADVTNEAQAIRIIQDGLKPDVIICEIFEGSASRIGYSRLKKGWPDIKVVVLSALSTDFFIIKAFQAGCAGYLTKDVNQEELFYCLYRVARGKRYLSRSFTIKLLDKRLKNVI